MVNNLVFWWLTTRHRTKLAKLEAEFKVSHAQRVHEIRTMSVEGLARFDLCAECKAKLNEAARLIIE